MVHPESLNSGQAPANLDEEDVFTAFMRFPKEKADNASESAIVRVEGAASSRNIRETDLPDLEPSLAIPSPFTSTGRPDYSTSDWNAPESTLWTVGGPKHSDIVTPSAFSYPTQVSTCHVETVVPADSPPSWGSGILWCDDCNSNRALDNNHQELLVWLMRHLGFDDEESKWGIFQNHITKKSGVMVVVTGASNQQAVASFIALCCYACYNQHRCSCREVEKIIANGFSSDHLTRRTINECYQASADYGIQWIRSKSAFHRR
jgi:hypothetical protein